MMRTCQRKLANSQLVLRDGGALPPLGPVGPGSGYGVQETAGLLCEELKTMQRVRRGVAEREYYQNRGRGRSVANESTGGRSGRGGVGRGAADGKRSLASYDSPATGPMKQKTRPHPTTIDISSPDRPHAGSSSAGAGSSLDDAIRLDSSP